MYTERENPFLFICHPTRTTTPSPHLSTPHRHFLAPAARVDIGRDCCSHCWYSIHLPTPHSSRGSARVRSLLFSPLFGLDSHRFPRASTHPPVTKARPFVFLVFLFLSYKFNITILYQICTSDC